VSIPLTVGGATFNYPQNFDTNWGVDATGWAQAVTNNMLQKTGGAFPLTADVNFGASFGLISPYFTSHAANPSTVGTLRLASADPGIGFRNAANSGNLILTTDASDDLVWGSDILLQNQHYLKLQDSGSVHTISVHSPSTSTNYTLTLPPNAGSGGQFLQTDGAGTTTWVNAAGSGTINSGSQYQLAYYAANGTTISGDSSITTNVNNQLLVPGGAALLPSYTFSNDPTTGFYVATPGILGIAVEHLAQWSIDINGLAPLNASATIAINDGVVSAPSLTFRTEGNLGIYKSGPATMGFATNGVNRLNIGLASIDSTVPITMGSNKITGLANGTAAQDAAAFGQIPVLKVPTVQRLTSSSGTYTTPSSPAPLYIKIKMVGAGGGGSGSGTSGAGDGGNGSASTFGTSFLSAGGGTGGTFGGSAGGFGGSNLAASTVVINVQGGSGQGYSTVAASGGTLAGAMGGSTPWGGGARATSTTTGGQSGQNETGEGGQGGPAGSTGASNIAGNGGGGGGYLEIIIGSPTGTQPYTVGAGGSAGSAGSNGFTGGTGASGIIIVEEYYQ